jgi:HAD superfamily hydrolase (TIGR01490 family)
VPRMVFFDIEGTLVSNNTWKAVMSHPDVARWRIRRAYAEVIPIWLLARVRLIDDIKFRDFWVASMAKLFYGWTQTKVSEFSVWVSKHVEYHADVVEKLNQHKREGDTVVLVSGIFEDSAKQFAAHLGADDGIGTKLAFEKGICTGKIVGASCAGARKLDFIQTYMQGKGTLTDMADCYAYGDSFSDAAMLSAVGHPVATYPENQLRALAVHRGWTVFPAG